MPAPQHKVSMNLSAADVENTKALKDRLHARSNAQVVSTALSVTASLSQIVEGGGELFVRNKDGGMEKLIITGLSP